MNLSQGVDHDLCVQRQSSST